MLKRSFIWSLHILNVCSRFSNDVYSHSSEDIRVAFVFAGSVRTFTRAQVHETLVHNLIHSFCPQPNCSPHIFMRLSLSDNKHEGAFAGGIEIKGDPNIATAVHNVLQRFTYRNSKGELIEPTVDWVDIGSRLENNQQKKEFQTSLHKLFRSLDSRRYSMYFNRYRAYQMAIQFENTNHMKFTWVVHARLDTAFGEPLRPYNCWSADRIWVHDTWYCDVPDTFAILPRNHSDMYFSMDALVQPGIMCLGGPNFHTDSLNNDSLSSQGFSDTEIVMAHQLNCLTAHPDYGKVKGKKGDQQFVWSPAGYSEFFLNRKLKSFGFSRQSHKIGYVQLFLVIVREEALNTLCSFLHASRVFPFLLDSHLDFHPGSDILHAGCEFFLGSNPSLTPPHLSSTNTSSTAVYEHLTGSLHHTAHSGSRINPSTDLLSPLLSSRISKMRSKAWSFCRLDSSSDWSMWNFLPFRLKIFDSSYEEKFLCLSTEKSTSRKHIDSLLSPRLEVCVDKIWQNNYLYLYSSLQFFLFHLVENHPQPIKNIQLKDDMPFIKCLQIPRNFHYSSNRSALFAYCPEKIDDFQLFRIKIIYADVYRHYKKASRYKFGDRHIHKRIKIMIYFDGSQLRRDDRSAFTNQSSNPISNPHSISHSNSTFCLCKDKMSTPPPYEANGYYPKVIFEKCDVDNYKSKAAAAAGCQFLIERTTTTGPVVTAPGLTRSKFSHRLSPTWEEVMDVRRRLPKIDR